MKLNIIIPVYNEATTIGGLLSFLKKNTTKSECEIIVVDAASTDDTRILTENEGATYLDAPEKGRAAQMHYAAQQATGDVLYFVHADSLPPASFFDDIEKAIHTGYKLGRYRTRFDSTKWYLKINAWFTRFDWFVCMGGDQTLFISCELYLSSGGFNPEMKIMEEFEFVKRVRKNARYKIFSKAAIISARKYEGRSWLQVQLANKAVVNLYKKGASQQQMIDCYQTMLEKKSS